MLLLGYYTDDGKLIYAGRVGTGMPVKVLADLRRRLDPLARKTSPLSSPPPRSTRFGSPLVLSRVIGSSRSLSESFQLNRFRFSRCAVITDPNASLFSCETAFPARHPRSKGLGGLNKVNAFSHLQLFIFLLADYLLNLGFRTAA